MNASPIDYIRDAELRGTLFEPENSTELVCGVDTEFFVDHDEPLAALGGGSGGLGLATGWLTRRL